MTAAVSSRTSNLGLALLRFNFPNWGDDANANMRVVDAAFAAIGVTVSGPWDNSVTYTVGMLVVDTDENSIYRCLVTHTSASSGSFAAERIAHPTYWEVYSATIVYRGAWTDTTQYYRNEIIYSGYKWGMAVETFISDGSYADDVTDGKIVTFFDGTATVNASVAAKDAAELAQTAAETAETNAETAWNNFSPYTTAVNSVYTNIDEIIALYGLSAEIVALYAIRTDISAVAAIDDDVSTVAANVSSIVAAAADIPSLSAKLNTDGSNIGNDAARATFLRAVGIDNSNIGATGHSLFRSAAGIWVPKKTWEPLYSGPMSGSVFDLVDLAQYDMLNVRGFAYSSTAANNFGIRLSADNGATFDGGSNYERQFNATTSTTADVIGTSTTDTLAYVGLGVSDSGLTAGAGVAFDVKIFNFRNPNKFTHFIIEGDGLYSDNSYFRRYRAFNVHKLARANNAMRIFFTSGTTHNSSYVFVEGWR